jgi:HlyD family secretion protein
MVFATLARSDQPTAVSALGRLEPRDGLYAISGPSGPAAVVWRLLVEEGQYVSKNQVIALLDDLGLKQANVERAKARRADAANALRRKRQLRAGAAISAAEIESLEIGLAIAEAELAQAEAELQRAQVKSPIDGQVVVVHTRDGERVGANGIVELGKTDSMLVIAEVYETDIGRVRIGQRVVATSPALAVPLSGKVERIGLKVGKLEGLATDPVGRTDARVIEVDVALDDSSVASGLTNLQVEVLFEP